MYIKKHMKSVLYKMLVYVKKDVYIKIYTMNITAKITPALNNEYFVT